MIIKKKSTSKRHHFIPKFYLNNFCDENGLLWIYDFNKKELRQQTPTNTAIRTNYYSFNGLDKKRHSEVEEFLASIEGNTKPIIDKINNKEIFDLDEKLILAAFISLLHSRVPYYEEEHNEILEKYIKIFNKNIFSSKENRLQIIKKKRIYLLKV